MEQEKPPNIYKHWRLWISMVLGIMVIYVITSISFYGKLVLKMPELNTGINLATDQLYKGLHDFDQRDNTITSTSADPWIEVKLEKEIPLRSIKIIVASLNTEQTNAQIYYASNGENFSGDKYVDFIMKKGENVINFPEGVSATNLRLDLTDVQGVSVNISSVDVKLNQNNLILFWLIFLGIALLYCGIASYVYFFSKNKDKSDKYVIKLLIIITAIFVVLYSKFIFGHYAYAFLDVGSDTIWGYAPNYQFLVQKILSGDFSMYSLNIGLGASTFSSITFFEFPFIILLFIFSGKNMYIGLLLATYLKYTLIAFFSFKYFQKLKFKNSIACICAVMWSYTGFNVLWGQHYWFLTGIVYFTLFMLLLENALQSTKKYWLFLVPVISVYSIINLYFLFSTLMFGGAYCIFRLYFIKKDRKTIINTTIRYIGFAILGILIGIAVSYNWINTFLESARSGIAAPISMFKFNLSPEYLTTLLGRFFSTSIFGTTNYSGINNLYEAPMLSTSMLIFGAILFVLKNNKKNIIFLLLIVISLISPVANFIFILTPTVERWYYVLAFVQIIVIGNYINELTSDKYYSNKFLDIATTIIPLFLLIVLYFGAKRLNMNLDNNILIFCGIFAILFWIITKLREYNKMKLNRIKILIMLTVCIEILVVNYPAINMRNMISIDQYHSFFENDTAEAVNYVKKNDDSLYRIKTYDHRGWLNDAEFYNYYGTDSYCSVSNKYYYEFIKNLQETDSAYSIANSSNYLDIAEENTAIQTLLGVKYITTQGQPPEGYDKYYQSNTVNVYKNTFSIPMGFAYYGSMSKQQYQDMTRQQKDLSLLNAFYTDDVEMKEFNKADLSQFDNKSISIFPSNQTNISTYGIDDVSIKNTIEGVTTNSSANLTCDFNKIGDNKTKGFEIGIDMESPMTGLSANIYFKKNGEEYTAQDVTSRYLIGGRRTYYVYVDAQTLTGIKIQPFAVDNDNIKRSVKIHNITVRQLNYDYDSVYLESAKQLESYSGENISYKNDMYTASFNNLQDKPAMFCVPIAYSQNWSAQINGVPTKIYRINDTMMGVVVEKGKSDIKLVWKTKGLPIAICISCISLLIYAAIIIAFIRKKGIS